MSTPVLRRLGDLQPIHKRGMNPLTEQKLRQMSDQDLLRTVTHPDDYQMVKARRGSNRVEDGNTRVHELQRRMSDPASIIKPDMPIPVDEDF